MNPKQLIMSNQRDKPASYAQRVSASDWYMSDEEATALTTAKNNTIRLLAEVLLLERRQKNTLRGELDGIYAEAQRMARRAKR